MIGLCQFQNIYLIWQKLVDLDAQDMIVTISSSSTETLVVTAISAVISSFKISISCTISPGVCAVSESSRKCRGEDDARVLAVQQLISVFQQLVSWLAPLCPSIQPSCSPQLDPFGVSCPAAHLPSC